MRYGITPVLILSAMLLGACSVPLFNAATPTPVGPTETPFVLDTPESATATLPPVDIPTAAPPAAATSLPPTAVPPATPVVLTTSVPATNTPNTINLRSVDWKTFLATDPNLNHPVQQPLPIGGHGLYVETKDSTPQNLVAGYPVLDGILYHRFSDDGQEAAVVTLYSGGTGGNFGLLIYKAGPTSPVLVASRGGYKLSASADGNQLLVREPLYAGWEPNCCPSGISETHYRLQGNQLVQTNRVTAGAPEMRQATVERFYDQLGQKRYSEAYALLSPRFQQVWPYEQWQAGYQNTISFKETSSPQADGSIAVDLVATDASANGPVTKHFTGTWSLIWSPSAKGWLLDEGRFNLVP